MTTWAKDIGGTLQYPTAEEFRGIPNWDTNEPACRKRGYLPLVGEAEPREGYDAVPSAWHKVEQSITRIEPRQAIAEDWETDPETGERRKIGEHTEMVDTEIALDKSYIQVDAWDYVPIPVPPPEPPPIVRYSKYALKNACIKRGLWEEVRGMIEAAGKWESFLLIQDLSSDNAELAEVMPSIVEHFGADVVEAVLAEAAEDENI